MENTKELAAAVAVALSASGLVGCDCCTSEHYYDADPCPVDEDGWKDHSYWGECWKNADRTYLLAEVAISALGAEGAL